MFIVNQMVNIKYYFEDGLPMGSNEYSIPICEKEFFLELIFYSKILVVYAICGLVLALCYIKKNKS